MLGQATPGLTSFQGHTVVRDARSTFHYRMTTNIDNKQYFVTDKKKGGTVSSDSFRLGVRVAGMGLRGVCNAGAFVLVAGLLFDAAGV